ADGIDPTGVGDGSARIAEVRIGADVRVDRVVGRIRKSEEFAYGYRIFSNCECRYMDDLLAPHVRELGFRRERGDSKTDRARGNGDHLGFDDGTASGCGPRFNSHDGLFGSLLRL